MRRRFKDLTAPEVLALAISLEEEDGRILQEFARLLRPNYPRAAEELQAMRQEEDGHRHLLVEAFRHRYGEEIPLIRRQDVQGFVRRDPLISAQPWSVQRVRRHVALMELETQRFYSRAAESTSDAELRQLLGDLAEAERRHEMASAALEPDRQPESEKEEEARVARQLFVLQVIQPGLAGLMDGSVSTLAPLFAAAFATMNDRTARGRLFGRPGGVGRGGHQHGFCRSPLRRRQHDGTRPSGPPRRGLRVMTFCGGIFHALPFLIPRFWLATGIATAVVAVELLAIAWIRKRYMESSFVTSVFQVVVGGALGVFGRHSDRQFVEDRQGVDISGTMLDGT